MAVCSVDPGDPCESVDGPPVCSVKAIVAQSGNHPEAAAGSIQITPLRAQHAMLEHWVSKSSSRGEDGGSKRARGPEEINKSDGRTSGATGAAGVSTVDPDGGAGILEDEQGDGAQSRWRRQTFSNGWLKHLEMMFARAVVSAI